MKNQAFNPFLHSWEYVPVSDLSDWRNEGIIYKKSDDPTYRGKGYMYAPDVCLAPDGKYYLYYAFTPGFTRKSWRIHFAAAYYPLNSNFTAYFSTFSFAHFTR